MFMKPCLVRISMQKRIWLLVALLSLTLIQAFGTPLALGASANTSLASSEWAMFRQDPSHSGYVANNATTNSAQLLWNYSTDRMVQSSPAIAYGCLIVGSRDSQVYCLNASNGELIWKSPIKSEVWSSPAIFNYSIYIGADDSYLYCLNIMNGVPLWRSQIGGGPVRSSPTIANGVVYASSQNNLYALNATNGNTLWKLQNLNPINSSPAFSNGTVYIASGDGHIYAFNASTGIKIWAHAIRTSESSSPAVANGYVYIGTYDGYLCALNASTGTQVWKFQTADEIESSPAIAYDCVYAGSEDNNLYCLNATSGSKIWQSPTGYWITSSPAIAGGNVYVGSQDDNIYCFNAATGIREWSYQTGNLIESSPAIANNVLYIGSDDWKVYALALTNSTVPPQPSPSANPMPITTIVFDGIACAIGAVAIFVVARYVYFTQRRNKTKPSVLPSQESSWLQRHADAVFILSILAFSSIFFVNLGKGVLQTADEQTYSQWAYHMVKTGDYLTPWANGAISFMIGKPPFLMWLMSLAYQVFGVTNFASRIWTVGFGAMSLVLIYHLGKKLYNRPVGFLSAIVLGTFITYNVFARYAMTDVPLTCFVLASIYFFVLSEEKEKQIRNAALSGLFFGLALMTKQIAALLIPLIIFAYLVTTRRSLRFLFKKSFTLLWGVGLLLFSPWLIYMAARFGNQFWQWYFLYADVERSASTVEGHFASCLFYFNYLVHNDNWLWLALLPFAVATCAYEAIAKRKKPDMLVFLWMAIVLLVFSLAQTKIYWYIMPVFPAFALAIAALLFLFVKRITQQLR